MSDLKLKSGKKNSKHQIKKYEYIVKERERRLKRSWGLVSFVTQHGKIVWKQSVNSAGWTGVVILQPRLDTLDTNRQ